MYKKLAIFSVSAAVIALAASPALANNRRSPVPSASPSKAGFFQKLGDFGEKLHNTFRNEEKNREHIASNSEAFRQEIRNRVTEAKKNQIKNWWNRAEGRLNRIIGRMDKVANRIEEKINKAEENGADVSSPRNELAAAKAKIGNASQSVASASEQIDSILEDNEPKEAFRKLHELQSGVMLKIREAHRALIGVLVSLKNVVTP